MKKLGSTLVAALLAAFLVGCQGGKPADMDQETYDLAQEAIVVGKGCVSGETNLDDAARRLGAIHDELEAYAPVHSSSHTVVETYVLCMEMEALGATGDFDKSEMQEYVTNLEEACK